MKTIYQTSTLFLFFVISYTTVIAQNTDKQAGISSPNKKSTMQVVFIDRFIVPTSAKAEFLERANHNRNFIRVLPGFIEDAAYEDTTAESQLSIITIAVWENEAAFKKAKTAVAEEYKREGFDPAALMKRLNIQIERGVFKKMQN